MKLVFFSDRFKSELLEEIRLDGGMIRFECSEFLWVESLRSDPAFAQCVWRNVQSLPIDSISDAQRKLRGISKRWRYLGTNQYRRGELICEKLDTVLEPEIFDFPKSVNSSPFPAFTLANEKLVLYSHEISRPTLNGIIEFNENKSEPPSRAYLKLWEALTFLGDAPKAGQRCIDLGSCPGSWTWALAELGCAVTSIDRSELAPNVLKYPNVSFKTGDAFAVPPSEMDWVFSDLICYPEKLFELALRWLDANTSSRFVFTIKFAGNPDLEIIQRFKSIPSSTVIHLYANKNELMWIRHPALDGTNIVSA